MNVPAEAPACAPLSDVEGRIAHVFLALPASDRVVSGRLLDCFRGIFEALGEGVRYTVLHHAGDETGLKQLAGETGVADLDLVGWKDGLTWKLEPGRARLEGKTLVIGRPPWPDFTHWVQDGFVVDGAPDAARLWATPDLARLEGGLDEQVPKLLAEHLGWRRDTLPCALEAGNLLVDRSGVLIGADVRSQSPPEAVGRLAALLAGTDRRVLWLPPKGPQPVFHQDLYLTLAGDALEHAGPLAIVGSVRASGEVLERKPLPDDPDASLDALATSLEDAGYAVARLPLLPFEDPRDGERRWVTYNNALVEVFRDGAGVRRRVVLPAYGTDGGAALEALDRAAERVWKGLGFEVCWARGPFYWLARAYGNLRCMVKVLRRGVSP